MAITQDQKTALLGVTSFMFDYAPDQESFARFESIIDGNPSFYALGRSLEKTDAFNSQFSDDAVLADKIDVILGRLGLESGSAGYDKGVEFITARVDDGIDFGQVLIEIGEKMLADEQLPELAAASATLKNKIAVAEHYLESGIEGYSSETLPALLGGIDDTQGSVNQAMADIDSAVPGVEGDTFRLTEGRDEFTGENAGTEDNDTFDAGIGQNALGHIVNTLSSADRIDGGAGNDTLNAALSQEAGIGGENLNVQPTTDSVENINIEARSIDNGSFSEGESFYNPNSAGTVTLDAKNMFGVNSFGSDYSDGDLVIQNVNTLPDSESGIDDARNTESMTVRMDHTSNFNSIGDASDLTVYFDDDYLIAGRVEGRANVSYEVMNQDAWDLINHAGQDGVELLDGVVFQELSFELNGEYIDLTEALNEDGDGQAIRTHDDLAAAINNALGELGLSSQVTAKVDGTFFERTAVETGEEREAPRVTLEGTPGNELNATEDNAFLAAVPEGERDIPASNRYDRAGTEAFDGSDLRTTVNVELEKVGRDGEGGDLQIGGKSQADTTGSGIQVFNIDVLGNSDQPSNLGTITSTNDTLETINIATGAEFAGSGNVADLTIRGHDGDYGRYGSDANTGPFGDNITNVNANDFEGNLTIGTEYAAQNLGSLSATGGGDVTFIGGNNDGATHNVTTGGGDDFIRVTSVNGSYTNISTNGGDDVVAVGGGELAEIDTGAGNDVIRGNASSVTVNAGEGDDVIYAENTGDKELATLSSGGDYATQAGSGTATAVSQVEVLNNRTVLVTVAMPEDSSSVPATPFTAGYEVTARVDASDGELTTERDLYEAAAKAINEDPMVNNLAQASVDDNGDLQINYLVDGEVDGGAGTAVVGFKAIGDWSDLSSLAQQRIVDALQEKYSDSAITDTDVGNLYDMANTETVLATGNGTDATTAGVNTVNGGTGDDVIVLSSNDATVDTVVFDQGGFGNDTIVHFNDAANGDVLDFTAWLDNAVSASGSVESEQRVATTEATGINAIVENSVAVTDFNTVETAGSFTGVDFDSLSDANMLAALNANSTFANSAAATGFVGNSQKSIVMVENIDAPNQNLGEYKVYEVTSEATAGSDNFTSATLVGTADFGDSLDFASMDATNFA